MKFNCYLSVELCCIILSNLKTTMERSDAERLSTLELFCEMKQLGIVGTKLYLQNLLQKNSFRGTETLNAIVFCCVEEYRKA